MKNPESVENNRVIDELLKISGENPFVKRSDIEPFLEKYGGMENLLVEVTRCGYLLHGSNLQIEEFEPRVPKKVEGRVSVLENEQKAIYASSDPVLPICMATVSRERMREVSRQNIQNGGKPVSFGAGTKPDTGEPYFYASQSLESFYVDGYVYIFEPSKFVSSVPEDSETAQHVAYESVKPVLVLPVVPSDFTHDIEVHP